MDFSSFLYRRLARFLPCELRFEHARIKIRTKYDIASFGDVFLHPFYWRMFEFLDRPPESILDLGANCGHFTLLAEACAHAKFPQASPRYVLVEPNPKLQSIIRRNLTETGVIDRCKIMQGLVGRRAGEAALQVNDKNFLSSSIEKERQNNHSPLVRLPFVNPFEAAADGPIDVLKIDIEGSEYTFLESFKEELKRVRLLMGEFHSSDPAKNQRVIETLRETGLQLVPPSLTHAGFQLMVFRRDS
jgi:FkbM family methyltransferase